MTKKHLQFGILFFTLFIDMLGYGIVIPVLPRYAEYLGATSLQIGMLVGGFSLAQLITLPFWGHLSDRIGRKPVLIVSVFGTACGYLLMGWFPSILIMMIGRIIDGAAGGNISTIQAAVSDITTPKERSKAMGSLGAAYGLGFIFGPALGGWASHHYGLSMPMFIASGLAVINLLLIVAFLPESLKTGSNAKPPQEGKALKAPSLLTLWEHLDKKAYMPALLTFFFFVTGFSIMTTLMALFVYHRYNMNEEETGGLYAMVGVIAIVIEAGLFGVLSKRFGDRLLCIVGAFFMAVTLFLIPLTRGAGVVIGVCAILSLGDSLISPALPAIVSRSVNERYQGVAFGLYQAVGSLARFIGPLLAGFFLAFDLYGPSENYARTAFWVASGLLVLSVMASLKIPKSLVVAGRD